MINGNLVELINVTKEFPGVIALKNVHFELRKGEVHAIVGENGAGKSTLVKILTGIYSPSQGEMFYEDEKVAWTNPMEAIKKGIAAIYQEPTVFPDLNIAENIFMSHQDYNPITKKINWKILYQKTNNILRTLNTSIQARDKIVSLNYSERQLVEIGKALSIDAKVIIMDEPTSALSASEADRLFSIIRDLKDNGKSIIFISHRLEDILEVADRVTVLRDGNYILTKEVKDISKEELIQLMVGRTIDNLFPKTEAKIGKELLRVDNLSKKGFFKDVSFTLHEGEIIGFYGLIGAGRTEVAKSIFGMMTYSTGKIFYCGKRVTIQNPREAIRLGMSYVTENRDEDGIILNMDVPKNITLPIIEKISKFGWMNNNVQKKIAEKYIDFLEIKISDINQIVGSLSGGNKQKVSLSKCLAANSAIIFFDEPTKGIDVGSKAAIHKFMNELAIEGYGILMISSELPEILGMSDRIIVMHEGRVKKIFNRKEATQEKILTEALQK